MSFLLLIWGENSMATYLLQELQLTLASNIYKR